MRHLRGLRVARRPLGRDVSEGASSAGLAWLDRPAVILSVNAWSVVAASVHSRANLRYSSRCRVSFVSSAALTSSRHGTHKAPSVPPNPLRDSAHNAASVPLSVSSL